MKIIRTTILSLLYLCYFTSIMFKSDFWGNLLSPVVTLTVSYLVYKFFYYKKHPKLNYLPGLFLSLGILIWAITDTLWAVIDLSFHQNPEQSLLVAIGYSLTNLCIVISLAVYASIEFRRWNLVQILLDMFVIIIFTIEMVWIFFLNSKLENLFLLRNDFISDLSVILDLIILIGVTIWYMSVRNRRIPLFLIMTAAGEVLFATADLIYHYQHFYGTYDPNTLLDAIYVLSFSLLAVAGYHKQFEKESSYGLMMNVGQGRKGVYLFILPVVIIIFKGFLFTYLLFSIAVILIYNLLTKYIQSNIHKEILLGEEKVLNCELDRLVKERTRELTEKNQALEELLNHDIITKLKNRRYLLNYLEDSLQNMSDEETVVLLYIDINRFKMITTMFGHFFAEQVLSEMAKRLKPLAGERQNSLLASYGEDMFILTARGNYDYEEGLRLAQQAISLGSDIYDIDNYQLRITVNIGISIYPYDAKTKEELIKHADIAMSKARTIGYNTIREFDEKLKLSFYRYNLLEVMLKKADFSKEFMVYYQPQLHAGNSKLIGFEALLRWCTPSGEFIPPSEFIPIAEESGLIVPIGNFVMLMALQQLAEWNRNREEKLFLGINVSLKQLNTIYFTQRLYSEIERLDLKPEWIDLEITESLQPEDNPEVVKMLQEIRSHGITVSIDDFGTGFSSLSYLKKLPVDRIKIARELVSSIHIDDFDYLLVKSIIEVSRAKGIKIIAEGIETEEQWEALKELQCDEVQGFLFGRPMPPQEAGKIITK